MPLKSVFFWIFTSPAYASYGLVADPVSCGPYQAVLAKGIAAARDFAKYAIQATKHPTSYPYSYFFLPESNMSVRDTHQGMVDALNKKGPTIPLLCIDSLGPAVCATNGMMPEKPVAWANGIAQYLHINICPWALQHLEPFPNPCLIPPKPDYVDDRERWPYINNIWLEQQTVADVILHELAHLPIILGVVNATMDTAETYGGVYQTHIGAMRQADRPDTKPGDYVAKDMNNVQAWEYMGKEAWREAEDRMNKGVRRRRKCAVMKREYPALFSNELKRQGRLTTEGEEGP